MIIDSAISFGFVQTVQTSLFRGSGVNHGRCLIPPTETPIKGLYVRRRCERDDEEPLHASLKVLDNSSPYSVPLVRWGDHNIDHRRVELSIVYSPAETDQFLAFKRESFERTAGKRGPKVIGISPAPPCGLKQVRHLLP
jgi:hypothetical protein